MKSEMLDIFNNCILVYRKTIQYIILPYRMADGRKWRDIALERQSSTKSVNDKNE